MAATAQINARIDASLKEAGDAALANAGFTPTQAVRALWLYASQHADNPREVRQLLAHEEEQRKKAESEEEKKRKLKLAEEGAHLLKGAYLKMGLAWLLADSSVSYKEMREHAYEEKYDESMGWDE